MSDHITESVDMGFLDSSWMSNVLMLQSILGASVAGVLGLIWKTIKQARQARLIEGDFRDQLSSVLSSNKNLEIELDEALSKIDEFEDLFFEKSDALAIQCIEGLVMTKDDSFYTGSISRLIQPGEQQLRVKLALHISQKFFPGKYHLPVTIIANQLLSDVVPYAFSIDGGESTYDFREQPSSIVSEIASIALKGAEDAHSHDHLSAGDLFLCTALLISHIRPSPIDDLERDDIAKKAFRLMPYNAVSSLLDEETRSIFNEMPNCGLTMLLGVSSDLVENFIGSADNIDFLLSHDHADKGLRIRVANLLKRNSSFKEAVIAAETKHALTTVTIGNPFVLKGLR